MISQELRRIFLADDDEDDCLLFRDALESLQLKTHLMISKDGVELMNALEENEPPSLLFLDLNMPLKSGFECLKEMKQREKLRNIPVVVLSTSGDLEHIESIFQHGANHYARKPGSFDALRALIMHVLNLDLKKSGGDFEKFMLQPGSVGRDVTHSPCR